MLQHPIDSNAVVGAGVVASTNDVVVTPGTGVDEILVCAQNGAAISGTVSGSTDAGSTYTVIGTYTAVKALSIGPVIYTTIKVASSGQPAAMYVYFNRRGAPFPAASANTSFMA